MSTHYFCNKNTEKKTKEIWGEQLFGWKTLEVSVTVMAPRVLRRKKGSSSRNELVNFSP